MQDSENELAKEALERVNTKLLTEGDACTGKDGELVGL
jgi:hypothetical protein